MSATVYIEETNGASGSEVNSVDPDNLNMGSVDATELVPSSYPITAKADGHAYEKWLRLFVSNMGGSSQVDNVKMWLSDLGGGWKTGEGMSCNLVTGGYTPISAYATPVDTDSTVATQAMPESEPGSANIGIGGSLSGSITSAPSHSDWVVLQLDVTASTPAGSLNTKTITIQWDEQ